MSDQIKGSKPTTEKAPVTTEKAPVTQVVKSAVSAPADSKYGSGRCPICGKPVMRPKDGGVGSTCSEHIGKLRQSAQSANSIPEGYVRMSKVCDAAQEMGLTRGSVVKASGGDACTGPILDEVFLVIYVGRAKYMHPDVLTKGLQLLKGGKAPQPATGKAPATPSATSVANVLKTAVKS